MYRIDIPSEVADLVLVILSVAFVLAVGRRIVRRSVRKEMERSTETLTTALRAALDEHQKTTVLAVRDEITGEIMQDMIDRALGKARAYGMAVQLGDHKGANGNVAQLHRTR